MPAENNAKVALIAKAYGLCNRGDQEIRRCHQVLCAFDPGSVQMRYERLAGHRPKEAHEVRLTHSEQPGCVFHRDVLHIMLVNIIKRG